MIKILILSAFSLITLGCKDAGTTPFSTEKEEKMMPVESNDGNGEGATSLEDAFASNIARAHHQDAFMQHPAIAFDIDINFDGKDRFDARITMLTNSSKIHMDKPDGNSLVFTGDAAYLSPETGVDENARFNMFTWPYFFGLPYKLGDPGTNLERLGKREFDGQYRETYKLTFDNGTGDTPDDWYIIYLNDNETVHAAAYIVTFGGKALAQAEENPHCIVYGDYQDEQTVPIATSWKFYNWSEAEGLQGEPIGEAALTNINFTDPNPNLFAEPQSAKLIE